jgi:phage-related protein
LKTVEFHKDARRVIRSFSKDIRVEFGSALIKVQVGMTLGMPISRPMPDIEPGVHEFRFRDSSGIQRVFYYTKSQRGILVFHAFTKKTQKTPQSEIMLGRKRLKEMLSDEKT